MPPLYDPEAVRPMWEELEFVGFQSLTTPEEVDAVLGQNTGTVLLVINSVCGCAAGGCRPGVTQALQNSTIPDTLVTVFAGVHTEATQRARYYMPGIPPSSPNAVLFKNGRAVHVLERRHIEAMSAEEVARNLVSVFDRECSRPGPSVPREVFERLDPVQECGSSIPLYPGDD